MVVNRNINWAGFRIIIANIACASSRLNARHQALDWKRPSPDIYQRLSATQLESSPALGPMLSLRGSLLSHEYSGLSPGPDERLAGVGVRQRRQHLRPVVRVDLSAQFFRSRPSVPAHLLHIIV